MKITLHKPQRETANAVLAYEGEEDDYCCIEMQYTWRENYKCDMDLAHCVYHPNFGDCTEYMTAGRTNGKNWIISSCL